jgi:hypothetical protein
MWRVLVIGMIAVIGIYHIRVAVEFGKGTHVES